MRSPRHEHRVGAPKGPGPLLVLLFLTATLGGVALVSVSALVCVVLDAIAAAIVLGPATLAGLRLAGLFLSDKMPLRWHFMLGAALGLGVQSVMILLLGEAGVLQRGVWIALLALMTIAGGKRLYALLSRARSNERRGAGPAVSGGAMRPLWLMLCPFLILALLAASNPPGFIWREEGNGYDVLAYHLQLPKEYRAAGRIDYLPHNVYANFPAGVEMHYLLGMILLDDVADAGTAANMIHLAFAALTVFAAWVIGREWSPRAGMIAALAMSTTGWLVYLSGLAYVENGLLFYGLTATGVLLRAAQGKAAHPLGLIALSGALTGFACGCKYTAVAMVALPLGLALLRPACPFAKGRVRAGLTFAGAALLTFSPWLIKNVAMTGNPVFPLASALFDAAPPGWGPEETRRWDRGHSAAANEPRLHEDGVERSMAQRLIEHVGIRLRALWRHLPGDPNQRFGPLVLLLGVGGLLWRKIERADRVLGTILLVQLAVWMLATHLFARFAVVLLIPLTLLAGRALPAASGPIRRRIVVTILIAAGLWNLAFAVRIGKTQAWVGAGAPADLIYDGALDGFAYFDVVNRQLPRDANVLLLGEARAFYFQRSVDYCVVFNRNPFVEAVRAAQSDREIVDWLGAQGYTHVLVNFSEVRRLRGSAYGFAPEVTTDLFDRLTTVGLSGPVVFTHPRIGGRFVELYTVLARP